MTAALPRASETGRLDRRRSIPLEQIDAVPVIPGREHGTDRACLPLPGGPYSR